jgi:hypothetical protein
MTAPPETSKGKEILVVITSIPASISQDFCAICTHCAFKVALILSVTSTNVPPCPTLDTLVSWIVFQF